MVFGRVGRWWWVVVGCGVVLKFTVGGSVVFTGWWWWVVVGTG